MALSITQIGTLLFKKLLGLGQTTPAREFFQEPYQGRSSVFPAQIWTDVNLIPLTASAFTASGHTIGVVQYWVDEPLAAILGTSSSFYSSKLAGAIPFNYGPSGSYNYALKDSLGGAISFGVGDWILDTDAGLVTFYSSVPANMPPTVTFYKYVGAKGIPGSSESASYATTSSYATSASWAPTSTTPAVTSNILVNSRLLAHSNAGMIASASYFTGSINLDLAYILYTVTVNKPSRIRFYTSASYQYLDLNRPYTVYPSGLHGVVADIIADNILSVDINPFIIGVSKNPSPTTNIAYTINSLTGSLEAFELTASYLPLENAVSGLVSASYALTASYAANSSAGSSISASWASSSISSSYATYAVSASYSMNAGYINMYEEDSNGDLMPLEGGITLGTLFDLDINGDLEPISI